MKQKYVHPTVDFVLLMEECVLLASPNDTSTDMQWEGWIYGNNQNIF